MRTTIYLLLLLSVLRAEAQPAVIDTGVVGEYRAEKGLNVTFDIYAAKNKLMLQIIGQGFIELTRSSPLVYQLKNVRPKATMVFQKDSTGAVDAVHFSQGARTWVWNRIGGDPGAYTGDFKLPANPYRILHVKEGGDRLMVHTAAEPENVLTLAGKDRFVLNDGTGRHTLQFRRDKQGLIRELTTTGEDVVVFDKQGPAPRVSDKANGFTPADSLLGALTPLRSCYDVLFYDLDVTLQPETKSIRGSNTIRFRVVTDFDRLQIDLHANLSVDRIVYHGQELGYSRKYNAVFVRFPEVLQAGKIDSFQVFYSGTPLEPNARVLQGGILWLWDRNANWWIETVTQGAGANLYWPCKDHLTDRPDSMRISVTIPTGLEEISNGRLISRTDLPGGRTKFVWYVDYPIVTYDVAIYIGDYIHFTDVFVNGRDSLPLNFYALRYNSDYAHWLFGDIKRMLALYYRDFGPYPFPRDGFNILEGLYPMEHQGAICMGLMNQPFNSRTHDTAGEFGEMWHESSHEWWGNSVGCNDYADMWFHEGFAQYAEFLNWEDLHGRDSALRELTGSGYPDNKEPIIGVYHVNNFHMGDMYLKGALMLETLRDLINNDSLWFSILRDIQRQFRYQPVASRDIENYFSQATGTDYTYLFDQYLRHAAIPTLVVQPRQDGPDVEVRYKWEADVADFRMPIKVTVARDSLAFIYPTSAWQTIRLKGMAATDLRVDTTDFYVAVRRE